MLHERLFARASTLQARGQGTAERHAVSTKQPKRLHGRTGSCRGPYKYSLALAIHTDNHNSSSTATTTTTTITSRSPGLVLFAPHMAFGCQAYLIRIMEQAQATIKGYKPHALSPVVNCANHLS